MPPLQELPHHDKDAGVGRIVMPPSPHATANPAPYPAPWCGSSFSSTLHYSGHAEPWRSATWPMINAAGCGAKSSPSGGAIVPIWWHACRRRPGTGGPPCGGVAKGAAPGSGVGGGGRGVGFAVRPPLPLCLAEYASVTAGQMPGDTDQDLHRSEALLGKCPCLSGVIRAVIAGPPLQAHHRGRGRGEHLARPRCGARGHVVGWMMDVSRYVMNIHHSMNIPKKMQILIYCTFV